MSGGMSSGARVVVGAVVMVLLIVGVVVGLGYAAKALLLSQLPNVEARAPQVRQQARDFGGAHGAADCVDEGLRRAGSCAAAAVGCQDESSLFVFTCLDVAADDPSTCRDLPSTGDAQARRDWARAACETRELGEAQWCVALMLEGVARQCADPGD